MPAPRRECLLRVIGPGASRGAGLIGGILTSGVATLLVLFLHDGLQWCLGIPTRLC